MTGRIAVGGASIDLDSGVVWAADGRETPLRPKTAEMLRTLVARRGEVLSKDALFDAVWPGVAVVEDNLVQCVSEIRAALGQADRGALRTVPKRGYVLDSAGITRPQVPALAQVRRPRLLIAVAVVAVIAAFLALWPSRPDAPVAVSGFQAAVAAETAAVDALHASVLVLPFEDLSEAGDLEHFADGMTEDLIAELSRWPEVRVIARNSANTFKGKAVDLRDAAAAMGVRYVLEGSVRRIGGRLRVTAQLVDGATGVGIWAERFDETGADVLALQAAVIDRLLQTLIGSHGIIAQSDTDKAWAKAAIHLDEYDYVLRGADLFWRRTPQDNAAAVEVWREGRRKFPDSGLLAIKEAWGHFSAGQFGYVEDSEAAFAMAARLVDEGMRDPVLPPAGYRLGHWLQVYLDVFYRRDYDAARRSARAVVPAFPYDAEGLFWMAAMMNFAGELALSREWIATALARDRNPTDHALGVAIDHAYLERRFEDAIAFKDRVKHLNQRNLPTMAASLVALGRVDEARDLLRDFSRDFPDVTPDVLSTSQPHRDPAVMPKMLAQLAEAGWPGVPD